MKSLRKEAERAQSAKLHRLGAQGSLKMAEKGLHAKRKYASGGTVSDPMPGVEGSAPKARLDRPSRGAKGAKGKKGTNVNVVIMQHPPMGGAGGPPPAGPMSGPMAMPPHPPMPAPMAGPPPGPMPMPAGGPPMRKHGGAVGKFAKGGAVKKKADGGEVPEKRVRAAGELDETAQGKYLKDKADNRADWALLQGIGATTLGGMAIAEPTGLGKFALGSGAAALGKKMWNNSGEAAQARKESKAFKDADEYERTNPRKNGGTVIPFESKSSKKEKASDEKKDKALAKPERAKGGGVPKMDAGTGSGEGRLEQAEMCAKTKRAKGGRVEMTAGAGSGEGRLEKGAIQKKIGNAT